MAALRSDEKCSRTNVYAPLFRRIDGLEAYINLLRLDMSSRVAGPSNIRHSLLTNLCQDQISNSQIALAEHPYINKMRREIPPVLGGALEHLARSESCFWVISFDSVYYWLACRKKH